MKKVCSNSKNYNLTEGKEYEIITELEGFVSVINDKGLVRSYSSELFKEIEEEKELTIEDLSWIIKFDYNETELYIEFKLGDEKVEKFVNLIPELISGNCGIAHIDGVNNLFSNILEVFDEDFGFSEVGIKPLEVFKDCIETISDEVKQTDKAMVVFSTNDEYEEIWTVLDEYSDLKTETMNNPNSGSDIRMWIKYLV